MPRYTVLVVEDEPDVRALVVESLRDADHAVLEAATGGEAIKLFEWYPEIDLIFTDIVMPGIDGFRVADMAKVRRPAVKILYATGYAHEIEAHLGVVHGRIMRKPYGQADLADTIARAFAADRGDAASKR